MPPQSQDMQLSARLKRPRPASKRRRRVRPALGRTPTLPSVPFRSDPGRTGQLTSLVMGRTISGFQLHKNLVLLQENELIFHCCSHHILETLSASYLLYYITSTGGGFTAPRIRNVEHGGLVAISGRSPRLLLCIHYCVS